MMYEFVDASCIDRTAEINRLTRQFAEVSSDRAIRLYGQIIDLTRMTDEEYAEVRTAYCAARDLVEYEKDKKT